MRKFGMWEQTECDDCGCDFYVTRAYSREVEGKIVCGECETWERAYEEGFRHGVDSVVAEKQTNTERLK